VRIDDLGDAAIWSQTAEQLYGYYRKRGLKVIFTGTFPYKIMGKNFKFYDEFIQLDNNKFTLKNAVTLASLSYRCRIKQLIMPAFSRYLGQGCRRLSWATYANDKIYIDKFQHTNRVARKLQVFLDSLVFTRGVNVISDKLTHELTFNREALQALTQESSRKNPTVSCKKIEKILIFPSCKSPVRRWPTQNFFLTAKALDSRGFRVKIIALDSELDADFKIYLPQNVTVNSNLSLDECVQEIKKSDCVIGNDSGPIHVGRAFGKAAVVLGWGGMYHRFLDYPEKENLRILYKNRMCANCICHSQSKLASCLKQVSEQDVLRSIIEIENC